MFIGIYVQQISGERLQDHWSSGIFIMQQCYMMLNIDPADNANNAPGVQNGPTAENISSHILTVGKSYKNFPRNHESWSFYISVDKQK